VFKHFRKLWGRTPESAEAPSAAPAVAAAAGGGAEAGSFRHEDDDPPVAARAEPLPDPAADELDALYRQALAAMDAVETGFNTIADELPPATDESSDAPQPPPRYDIPGVSENPWDVARATSGPGVTPQQVLEAALFVGGIDLTLKRLCSLLNDEFPPDAVERFINELNQRYEAEGRPYEIRFGTGGYRMHLRADYDAVRNRVFGLGPREVKLSQDALEVLSLIAYQQPIAGNRITELRGANATAVVRQLLRRELVALERPNGNPRDVRYCTTPRFLQAFGMHTLGDLPRVDDLAFK
jgi:segregation and condensation protein B